MKSQEIKTRVDKILHKMNNPWEYEDFDPSDPFKHKEELREELNKLAGEVKNQ